MLNIFIGYDSNETVAFHVLSHSIMRRSSRPVSITPLVRAHLPEFTRPRDARQSTEFSFTRFLVPYLSGWSGWSLFMDCDMLVRCDIQEIMMHADPAKSVMVVKHDYTPKTETKFLGQAQTKYEKKNWSSVMLFNNKLCKKLTPEYVNSASGLELHQFKWLEGDHRIGALPKEWNHLVGEYDPDDKTKIVHYTIGGPYFHEYKNCDFAQEWFMELEDMNRCKQYDTAETSCFSAVDYKGDLKENLCLTS